MNTYINNLDSRTSFQAGFKIKYSGGDSERLNNIKKLFTQKTKHYPDDTLVLYKDKEAENSPALRIENGQNSAVFVFQEGLNGWMSKYTDNDIAKKLVKVFKSLKAEQKYNELNSSLRTNISCLGETLKLNSRRAEMFKAHGQAEMAARYETLAAQNNKRLRTLQEQKQNIHNEFLNKLDNIIKDDPELAPFYSIFC